MPDPTPTPQTPPAGGPPPPTPPADPPGPNGGTPPPTPPGEKAYTLAEVRQALAGGDDKRLKQMERFTDLPAIGSAYWEAQTAISKHGLRLPPPGPEARPEDIAAYRAQRGVPEKPEGYLQKLPGGLTIGEIDKPKIDSFAAVAHEMAVEPAAVHRLIKWYYDIEAADNAEHLKAEAEAVRKTEADLVGALGPVEYRRSNDHLNTFLAKHGEAGKMLKAARGPDGIPILDTPLGRKWMMDMARAIDPIGVLMPGTDGGDLMSIEDELKKIDDFRRKDRSAYNKDVKMQERERDLIDAKLALQKRQGK